MRVIEDSERKVELPGCGLEHGKDAPITGLNHYQPVRL